MTHAFAGEGITRNAAITELVRAVKRHCEGWQELVGKTPIEVTMCAGGQFRATCSVPSPYGDGNVERERLIAHLERRHMSPAVQERILRLNPNLREGERLRGYHPHAGQKGWRMMRGLATKGEVIRSYGRVVWNAFHPKDIVKDGKRCYVPAIFLAEYRALS